MKKTVYIRWPWKSIDLERYNDLHGIVYNLSQYHQETLDQFLQRVGESEYLVGAYTILYGLPKHKSEFVHKVFVVFYPTAAMSLQEAIAILEKAQRFGKIKSSVRQWVEFKIVRRDALGV